MTSLVQILDANRKSALVSTETLDGIQFHHFHRGTGMTTWLINLANESIRQGKTLLFVSANEQRAEVVRRLATNNLDNDQTLAVCGASDAWQVKKWDVVIFDDAGDRFKSRAGAILGLRVLRDLGAEIHLGWR